MRKRKPQPVTQAQLHHLFVYDPETGVFTSRLDRHRGRWKAGERVGSSSGHGYRRIHIDGIAYYEHQLAWLYMTGEWRENCDHENRDGSDNRWVNLRKATDSQQQANRGINKNNTTGYRGVSYNKRYSKYEAYLTVNRKRRRLGLFKTAQEAHEAYIKASRESFGVYASTG